MTWKANASEEFELGYVVLRLADIRNDDMDVATGYVTDGSPTFQTQSRAVEVPTFLRLPYEAAEALRDALNGHMPPRDDRDLRDALRVERERVDRVLDRLTGREDVA